MFQGSYEVESKYLYTWEHRELTINTSKNMIVFTKPTDGTNKSYVLESAAVELYDPLKRMLVLNFEGTRLYRIRETNNRQSTVQSLYHFIKRTNSREPESQSSCSSLALPSPQSNLEKQSLDHDSILINDKPPMVSPPVFFRLCLERQNPWKGERGCNEDAVFLLKGCSVIERPRIFIPKYLPNSNTDQRAQSYYNVENWTIGRGGMAWSNKQKENDQKKILIWLSQNVFTNGSLKDISFPVFWMKPESLLESLARCFGSTPLFMEKKTGKLQRIKAFVSMLCSFSIQSADLQKPFSPLLGETFQGYINGDPVYAEQISCNPMISAFLYVGKGYQIHMTLSLQASLGLYSGTCIFHGDVQCTFTDGTVLKGRLPNLQLITTGIPILLPTGSIYVFDCKSKIICSLKSQTKDHFDGYIGFLKQPKISEFLALMKKQQRHTRFEAFSKTDYQQLYSGVRVIWSKGIYFNSHENLVYSDPKWLPYILQEQKYFLPSQSSLRTDIRMKELKCDDQAEQQKQLLLDQQRTDQRLREKKANMLLKPNVARRA